MLYFKHRRDKWKSKKLDGSLQDSARRESQLNDFEEIEAA